MEFLQANWLWLLVAVGVGWFLFRRGGMGCGMGDHSAHGSRAVRPGEETSAHTGAHDGHGRAAGPSSDRPMGTGGSRRHRGCC